MIVLFFWFLKKIIATNKQNEFSSDISFNKENSELYLNRIALLLEKISENGYSNLTVKEKKLLDHYHNLSERQKKDLEYHEKTKIVDNIRPSDIVIGNQTWMNKNYMSDKFSNGEQIPHAISIEDWEEAEFNKTPCWCYYYFRYDYGNKYGILYNWYAVNDKRGLAPSGYHIPSKEEWEELIEYLGGEDIAGRKLKSETGWISGSNFSGFNALPGGYCDIDDHYHEGEIGCWWSSTQFNSNEAYFLQLEDESHEALLFFEPFYKGFSVRCIKDS